MRPEEQTALVRERTIAKMTNIDKEDFTHAYQGVSVTIQAGREFVGRLPEIEHLAFHLARKMLAREAKSKISKDNPNVRLWTPEQIAQLQQSMISTLGQETPMAQMTPEAERAADRKRIEQEFMPGSNPKPVEVTKKDVIADLKARGAAVDVTKTKEELLAQLMEMESQGK